LSATLAGTFGAGVAMGFVATGALSVFGLAAAADSAAR